MVTIREPLAINSKAIFDLASWVIHDLIMLYSLNEVLHNDTNQVHKNCYYFVLLRVAN